MSPYGLRCVKMLVPELVRLEVAVVSGLALGIDGAVHREALAAGGRTVAIIGSGIDDSSIYPRAHLGLAKDIIGSGGCLISEYPPRMPSLPHHFPERNRIIAGLSKAVLVIEAPRKSGAMITARLALEAGIEVWAVPGAITDENSAGPNELIRNGATPIAGMEDISEALGLSPSRTDPLPDLPPEEKTVFDALRGGPLSSDELAKRLGIPPPKLAILLTSLEMRGIAGSFGGSRYGLLH
jgi:DNA processing protein